MDLYHHQDYSMEQIAEILQVIQTCVKADRYVISLNENRQENRMFLDTYRLTHEKQKKILLSVLPEDFCHTLNNRKSGYEHEVLYVFVPQVELHDIEDRAELVDIYLKFNIMETGKGNRVVVISFHRRDKAIRYPFRCNREEEQP